MLQNCSKIRKVICYSFESEINFIYQLFIHPFYLKVTIARQRIVTKLFTSLETNSYLPLQSYTFTVSLSVKVKLIGGQAENSLTVKN